MQKTLWGNTSQRYGRISILLHWVMALMLIGMYLLGDYMVDLDYYDPWYHDTMSIHKAIGVFVFLLLVSRYLWNKLQTQPHPLQTDHTKQNFLAKAGHNLLYLLVLTLIVSGYLISTAKGQGIDVFGWFDIPVVLADDADRGELAGDVHNIVGTVFAVMVALHAVAALIHHFIFKDKTSNR